MTSFDLEDREVNLKDAVPWIPITWSSAVDGEKYLSLSVGRYSLENDLAVYDFVITPTMCYVLKKSPYNYNEPVSVRMVFTRFTGIDHPTHYRWFLAKLYVMQKSGETFVMW